MWWKKEKRFFDKLSNIYWQSIWDFYDINVVDKPEHKAMVELISDDLMADYADLVLGRKIRDCIKRKGDCYFTAEF